MALASASSSSSWFFTSPKFSNNSTQSSSFSSPSSVRYAGGAQLKRICATYATTTAERTATASSSRIGNPSSLYEVLGIQMEADVREIKAAYRRLARELHPDVRNGDSSADEFIRVHSAYATLSDPGKRANYDRSLFVRQRSTAVRASSPTRFNGYSSRRWETDQCWRWRMGIR